MVHSCERDSSAFLPSHVAIEPITKGLLSASLDSPVAIAVQKVSGKAPSQAFLGVRSVCARARARCVEQQRQSIIGEERF